MPPSRLPIPQRNNNPAPAPASATDVHAAFAAIGHNSASVEDLARLLQPGPAGTALRFVAAHLLGRPKVAHVRSELHRLRKEHGEEDVSAQHTRATAKLAGTRKEVAARQRELAELQAEARSLSTNELTELSAARTTAHLLQVLLAKEQCRVARLKNLTEKALSQGGMTHGSSKTSTSGEALAQIRALLTHRGGTAPTPRAIQDATSSAPALRALHTGISKIKLNEDKPVPRREDLEDVLTVLRMYHVNLGRTLSDRTPSQTLVARAREAEVRDLEEKARQRLRERVMAELPKMETPDAMELDKMHAAMKDAQERAQKMVWLFQGLVKSVGHVTNEVRARVERLKGLSVEAGVVGLTGYVEAERQRIVNRTRHLLAHEMARAWPGNRTDDDEEIRALTRGMKRMMEQSGAISEGLRRRREMEGRVSAEALGVQVDEILEKQRGEEIEAERLVSGKREKLEKLGPILEKDIARFVEEEQAVVFQSLD